MITVTTADSKYSRHTDFGGPFGFVSACGGRLWPFRPKSRDRENGRDSVLVSEVPIEVGPLEGLFVITKIILDTLIAAVKFTPVIRSGSRPRERQNCWNEQRARHPESHAVESIKLLSRALS